MRHLEIRDWWLQDEVRNGRLEVREIAGNRNPVDLMTKALPVADIVRKFHDMNIKLVGNR